jgi:hypothetical protein
MTLILKTILIIMLVAAVIFDFPYGYYQLLRFVSFAAFLYLGFISYQLNNKEWAFLFIALALLFQPFIKIALGRLIWNVVDIAAALLMLISMVANYKKVE